MRLKKFLAFFREFAMPRNPARSQPLNCMSATVLLIVIRNTADYAWYAQVRTKGKKKEKYSETLKVMTGVYVLNCWPLKTREDS